MARTAAAGSGAGSACARPATRARLCRRALSSMAHSAMSSCATARLTQEASRRASTSLLSSDPRDYAGDPRPGRPPAGRSLHHRPNPGGDEQRRSVFGARYRHLRFDRAQSRCQRARHIQPDRRGRVEALHRLRRRRRGSPIRDRGTDPRLGAGDRQPERLLPLFRDGCSPGPPLAATVRGLPGGSAHSGSRLRFAALRRSGYAQLSATAPAELRRGGENRSEIGVFNRRRLPIRQADLEAKVTEFLAGLRADRAIHSGDPAGRGGRCHDRRHHGSSLRPATGLHSSVACSRAG